ncbi:heme exporter protein CcmD [Colwellia sp. MB3u-28]|uniref:heme exporter protein CcmD n=1 Tax=unclassified Colwellia TaxID=196834 RepID=UPI0015F5F173|nr:MULTISPECIES: heme exporter protein CcmD [unclassified Colwellia]MBA6230610.1 heme exporter protein CcmD [Colwellia sp. MB02u-7]MBA6234541.1 heme exporter protein CcmD [Colwellia sp. MB02u-11]MBA6255405.1 heme exporter protein CcmD [Colwellia sp. MB3u-28]MBA6261545.1 heme exporter protein CcmD [Colwellia sp. MB3u-41]MBA6301095.1 heme exporter protein CcmD [Colwellia sp. MB3u-22]
MQFDSISAFFDMGGYAFFVWLSYGVSAFLLAALVYSSHNNHKNVKNKIAQRLQREIKLRKAAEKSLAEAKQTDDKMSVVQDLSKKSNKVVP